MSTHIKLSKAQISKIIQSDGSFGYKKYKLFDITKFILVLPTFQLVQ